MSDLVFVPDVRGGMTCVAVDASDGRTVLMGKDPRGDWFAVVDDPRAYAA